MLFKQGKQAWYETGGSLQTLQRQSKAVRVWENISKLVGVQYLHPSICPSTAKDPIAILHYASCHGKNKVHISLFCFMCQMHCFVSYRIVVFCLLT